MTCRWRTRRASRASAWRSTRTPDKAFNLTIKRNTVAVVSDGTAVLGLGDIGPEAAMPVMEGKALLFKEFGGVDAFPICLATKDPTRSSDRQGARADLWRDQSRGHLRAAVLRDRRPAEGGPRHSGLPRRPARNGDRRPRRAVRTRCKIVGKDDADVKVVVNGVGAAGVACTEIVLAPGVKNITVLRHEGALYAGRHGLDQCGWRSRAHEPPWRTGRGHDVLRGADVFVGVSGPGAVTEATVRRMAPRPIVFAMANPEPEIVPEEVADPVAVMATGRSDYPNQINNVLAFPASFAARSTAVPGRSTNR